ncbi:MAG TPA: hypothetical protein PLA83_06675 [Deltaproteobacteria bacterium]|nr:hypothetical protein [Deltaproteobacteria bacterium]HQH99910.1 hypothetical protein [Deltaproteobacteria bacterium]HQJ10135.1 hypothetical protein [Deltaproteobacteria bacterium]
MKRPCFRLPGCFLIMALLGACMSSKAIPLPADFWTREKLTIGVALAGTSEPKVKESLTLFGRPLPYGSTLAGGGEAYDEGGEYSDQGEMQSEFGYGGEGLETRDYGSSAKHLPAPSAETGTLEERLRALDAKLPMAVQKHFVKRLEQTGYRAVPIQGDVSDVRQVKELEGYDALVIIDCKRYGVFCPTRRSGRELASVNADMQARMVDLASGKIIWQSPRVEVKNPVSCSCDDAGCFPKIRGALERSVAHVGDAMLSDLFRNRP